MEGATKRTQLPFTGRTDEVREVMSFLESTRESAFNSRQLIISGASGVGKSRFLFEILKKQTQFPNILHIDAFDSLNDNYLEDLFFEVLIYQIIRLRETDTFQVGILSKRSDFLNFLRNNDSSQEYKIGIYQLLKQSLSYIPHIGDDLQTVFPDYLPEIELESINYTVLFFDFLKYVSVEEQVLICIDNIQFIPSKTKDVLSEMLSFLPRNIALVTIVRTLQEENLSLKRIWEIYSIYKKKMFLNLESLSEENIAVLIKKFIPNLPLLESRYDEIVEICNVLSKGNLKEVEQYLLGLQYKTITPDRQFSGEDSATHLNILQLPKLKRNILILVSMFPTGIRIDYVQEILEVKSKEEINIHLEFLVKYHLINKAKNSSRIWPAHEKINTSIEELVFAENIIELRQACIKVFEARANMENTPSEYIFLMNSLIGIQSLHELRRQILLLTRYIEILDQSSQFSKVIYLYDQLTTDDKGNRTLELFLYH